MMNMMIVDHWWPEPVGSGRTGSDTKVPLRHLCPGGDCQLMGRFCKKARLKIQSAPRKTAFVAMATAKSSALTGSMCSPSADPLVPVLFRAFGFCRFWVLIPQDPEPSVCLMCSPTSTCSQLAPPPSRWATSGLLAQPLTYDLRHGVLQVVLGRRPGAWPHLVAHDAPAQSSACSCSCSSASGRPAGRVTHILAHLSSSSWMFFLTAFGCRPREFPAR